MNDTIVTKKFSVIGMTCTSCELRIENALKKEDSIFSVEAKYIENSVNLSFDSSAIDLLQIIKIIEVLDYKVTSVDDEKGNLHKQGHISSKRTGIVIAVAATILIVMIIFLLRNTVGLDFDISNIAPGAGYGVLFVIGLITSLHCIAMCGGINLSLCASYKSVGDNKLSKLAPSILYNVGRVISYTLIGGVMGSIGSVINISAGVRGVGAILSGTFMILMGINMLNILPELRKVIPKMPKVLGIKIYDRLGKSSPFVVGLLNGFMPCGSLQSIQIYALGTGSLLSGALSMFFFSTGTVPLMFGLGAVSSLLSEKFTNRMMKVSAVLIAVLGFFMLIIGLVARQ